MQSIDQEFDDAMLSAMRDAVDHDTFQRLLRLCCNDLGEQLHAIAETRRCVDPRPLRPMAHRIRGLSGQFGLAAVSRLCLAIEATGDDDVDALIEPLLRHGERARTWLKDIVEASCMEATSSSE